MLVGVNQLLTSFMENSETLNPKRFVDLFPCILEGLFHIIFCTRCRLQPRKGRTYCQGEDSASSADGSRMEVDPQAEHLSRRKGERDRTTFHIASLR